MKTILTRVAEGCRLFIFGSTRQIDNKFVNKHTSGLTYIFNRIKADNGVVNIGGMRLVKTVRSRIAELADTFK
jgi:predicted ribonuclease YlaK